MTTRMCTKRKPPGVPHAAALNRLGRAAAGARRRCCLQSHPGYLSSQKQPWSLRQQFNAACSGSFVKNGKRQNSLLCISYGE
jgi:hypothetical protein